MEKSTRYTLNKEDWRNIVKNIGLFATPLAIAFLTSVQNGVPIEKAAVYLQIAAIQAIIDILRKWLDDNKPKDEGLG